MFEHAPAPEAINAAEIARYEVSEDGRVWRSYDPARDDGRLLHKRIEFAPPADELR
jgi:hypothetical protein